MLKRDFLKPKIFAPSKVILISESRKSLLVKSGIQEIFNFCLWNL